MTNSTTVIFPIRLFAAVAAGMGKSDVRYYLNGICMERLPESKGVRAVSTDGHVLIIARDETVDWPIADRVILPRQIVDDAMKAAKGNAWVTLELYEGGDVITTIEDRRFHGKLIDSSYPNYEAIIPRSFNGEEATFDPELIEKLVKSAKALKKCGAMGSAAGIRISGNGSESSAGVVLCGFLAKGFAVGGVLMPRRNSSAPSRENFLDGLMAG